MPQVDNLIQPIEQEVSCMLDPKLLATVHMLDVVVLGSARGNHEPATFHSVTRVKIARAILETG